MNRLILLTMLIMSPLCSVFTYAQINSSWPQINFPKEMNVFDIATQITTQGLPMRLIGFSSELPPNQIYANFKKISKITPVENKQGNKLILGYREGDYYVTIQIEPNRKIEPHHQLNETTKGIISMTNMKAAMLQTTQSKYTKEAWSDGLPPRSKIISLMEMQDAGKSAAYITAFNQDPIPVNIAHITRWMAKKNYKLEHESQTKNALDDTKILLFRGVNKEAMIILSAQANQNTNIIINTIISLDTINK